MVYAQPIIDAEHAILIACPGGGTVDTGDLKSPGATRAGSNPAPGTNYNHLSQNQSFSPLKVESTVLTETELRHQMCQIGRLLWERGLVGAGEGNLTCRLPNGHLLTTPAGAIKGKLEPEMLVTVTTDGDILCHGIPSSELKLHLRIYKERPDCRAVVHAHPLTATGMASAGFVIKPGLFPEADLILGEVALVPFALPGTDAMGDVIANLLPNRNTLLLANHGAVTLGSSLDRAYLKMETLERVSQIYFTAKALGGPTPLPSAAKDWLIENLDKDTYF